MRIDADECRDPDLLASEVRRLQAVVDAGEPTLTAAEREAVEWAAAIEPEPSGRWTKTQEAAWNQRSATLRGLLERL
jgi:hypothetical protein